MLAVEREEDEAESNPGLMPWETDDDLKSLSAVSVREVIWDELSLKEKAKLNELCIDEMQKEILKMSTSENELVIFSVLLSIS